MIRPYPLQLHTNFFYTFVQFNILNNSGHMYLSLEFLNALFTVLLLRLSHVHLKYKYIGTC